MSTDVAPGAHPAPGDPYASDPDRPLASAARPWWRWLFVVPGLLAVTWGVLGVLREVALAPWALWFVGGALVHDVVVAPLVVVVGALLARVLPGPARPPVVVGLVASAVLVAVGILFVLDPGNVDEPGFLPQDHARNLSLLVGGTVLVSAVWAVLATVRARR